MGVKMKPQPTERYCPDCEETKPMSEFTRKTPQNKLIAHRVCNSCAEYERFLTQRKQIRLETLINSLTIKKVQTKPVWMVVYRSFP